MAVVLLAATATGAQAQTPPDAVEAPAVAVGGATSGAVAFRLEGDRLTVTLRQRLAPRGSGMRPSVKLICGMAAPGAADRPDKGLAFMPFAISARRDLRIAAGVRTIRARLGADVARWATLCGIRWQSRAGSATVLATMALRRGTPPGCAAPPGAWISAESEGVLVLGLGPSGERSGGQFLGCGRPDGAWRLLDTGWSSKYFYGRYLDFEAAGSWLGWSVRDIAVGGGDAICALRRVDFAAEMEVQELPVTPDGYCATSLAVGPGGQLAWIATDWNGVPNPREDVVGALDAGGATVILDSAGPLRLLYLGHMPGPPLTDLAIGADGRTVTWRDDGVLRSASP